MVEGGQSKPPRVKFSEIPSKARWLIYLTSPSSLAFGYFYIAVSAYLVEEGVSSTFIGLILASSAVAAVLIAIPMGIRSDKVGRKKLFILGLFGIPPTLVVYAFTSDPIILLIAGIGAGVAEGAFMATWNALIADMNKPETRTSAFSLSFIVGTVTSAFGFVLPFFFPFIEDYFNASSQFVHRTFFLIVAVAAVISPISLMTLLRDYKEVVKPEEKRPLRGKNFGLIMKFSGCNSLIGLGAGFIIPLIPTWLLLKFGVPDSSSGPLLAVANITMGFSAIVSTALAVRYGSVRAIVLTQGLATVFMLSLAYVPSTAATLAGGLYLVRAALMNMATPISDSYLMSIVMPEERGLASSINAIIWRLPNSASTVVGGALLKAMNFTMPFYLATIFYAVSIALLYVVFRNIKTTS